ncbi:hypothetical protein Anapl_17607 [Anas platyrhynchos]|uniref:Uncharacterized protein n=1 Tax=Anas platyrhynchos TaxID=8839 RepID=R0L7R7_ANAPL|nr:hypothetical protein Anapl_17607 [Anas platyrhynchos]
MDIALLKLTLCFLSGELPDEYGSDKKKKLAEVISPLRNRTKKKDREQEKHIVLLISCCYSHRLVPENCNIVIAVVNGSDCCWELKGECSVFETIMSKENPLISGFAGDVSPFKRSDEEEGERSEVQKAHQNWGYKLSLRREKTY